MPYSQIVISQEMASDAVIAIVADRVEPFLRDTRRMLELPIGPDQPAFNLSVATILFGVIGGLSRIFFRSVRGDRRSFFKSASHYPIDLDGSDAIFNSESFAGELYEVYRCNLVHSLGLALDWNEERAFWELGDLGTKRKVIRHVGAPLTEDQWNELEVETRPVWLEPTITNTDGTVRLTVESLYWGVRHLVKTLSENQSLTESANAIAGLWYRRRKDGELLAKLADNPNGTLLPRAHEVMSSTSFAVSTRSAYPPLPK